MTWPEVSDAQAAAVVLVVGLVLVAVVALLEWRDGRRR